MAFLPDDYQAPPKTGGNYFKPQDGDNRCRIVGSSIVGWVGWDKSGDKPKPVRVGNNERATIAHLHTAEDGVKHFWAFPVVDRADGLIKIWEVTQASIQEPLKKLTEDADWGHPGNYDIGITRTGVKKETSYTVVPKPKKPAGLTERQKQVVETLDLDALMHDTDPFANVPEDTTTPQPAEPAPDGFANAEPLAPEPERPAPVLAGDAATYEDDDIPF